MRRRPIGAWFRIYLTPKGDQFTSIKREWVLFSGRGILQKAECRTPNGSDGLVIKVKKLSESPLFVILCFIFDQTQSHSAFGVLQNTPLPLSIISCYHIVNGILFF